MFKRKKPVPQVEESAPQSMSEAVHLLPIHATDTMGVRRGGHQSAIEAAKVRATLSQTHLRPEHIAGLSSIDVRPPTGTNEGGAGAEYDANTRGITVHSIYHSSWIGDDERQNVLAHEIGHHVHYQSDPEDYANSSSGRAEAMAQNFADDNTGDRTRSFKELSHDYAAQHEPDAFDEPQGNSAAEYRQLRGSSVFPGNLQHAQFGSVGS